MRPETLIAFHRWLERQAELNETEFSHVHAGGKFSVTPSVSQTLRDRMMESSAFLQAINIEGVRDLKGEKIGLGVSGPLAGRSNTAGGTKRTTTDPHNLESEGYEAKQTNSDTHIRYNTLDTWARYPDFQTRIRNHIIRQQALDRIMIGWNGESAAVQTDKAANPMLQDVNVGWLKHIRDYQSGIKVLDEGETEDGKIIVDPTGAGDYYNLDAVVVDAVFNIMPTWAQNNEELVVILGADLQHAAFFPLVNAPHEPTEKIAADLLLGAKKIGGKRPAAVPFFPNGSMLITPLSNLSIYEQDGSRRKSIKDVPELDRIETYESCNEAYVVEDYDHVCLVENVQFGPTAP